MTSLMAGKHLYRECRIEIERTGDFVGRNRNHCATHLTHWEGDDPCPEQETPADHRRGPLKPWVVLAILTVVMVVVSIVLSLRSGSGGGL